MTTFVVRPALPDDAHALAALKLLTFRQTFVTGGFAIPYPPNDLTIFETESYALDRIVRELADTGHATWVAETDGQMLGYAHVGPCKLPHSDVRPTDGELYQLYIRDAAQGAGIGRALLRQALDHLALTRPGPVWLGVWSGNVRAQAIYASYGFDNVGGYDFPVGSWTDREFIYRREHSYGLADPKDAPPETA